MRLHVHLDYAPAELKSERDPLLRRHRESRFVLFAPELFRYS